MADIDAAIAAAQKPQAMARIQVSIHTSGRAFAIEVPPDLRPDEALAICGYVATLPERLAEAQHPKSRILVPRPS